MVVMITKNNKRKLSNNKIKMNKKNNGSNNDKEIMKKNKIVIK